MLKNIARGVKIVAGNVDHLWLASVAWKVQAAAFLALVFLTYQVEWWKAVSFLMLASISLVSTKYVIEATARIGKFINLDSPMAKAGYTLDALYVLMVCFISSMPDSVIAAIVVIEGIEFFVDMLLSKDEPPKRKHKSAVYKPA